MQLADDTHAAVVSPLATRNTDSGQSTTACLWSSRFNFFQYVGCFRCYGAIDGVADTQRVG
jgi:hypothetical protein